MMNVLAIITIINDGDQYRTRMWSSEIYVVYKIHIVTHTHTFEQIILYNYSNNFLYVTIEPLISKCLLIICLLFILSDLLNMPKISVYHTK